ncbi:BREX system ATP-binding domain-containing protein [Deltaproteobacteria bacterium TL4]
MDDALFLETLTQQTNFALRRAVERLREGLFDSLAVRLLTAHESHLNQVLDAEFQNVAKGNSSHYCVCGAYGQGKSHTLTYIQDRALQKNFVTSMVNLDLREVPFNNFTTIYRELLSNLQFPDSKNSLAVCWKNWFKVETVTQPELKDHLLDLLPKEMPLRFKSILTAMVQKNVTLTEKQKQSSTHVGFRPKEFTDLLSKSLSGFDIPLTRLRQVFKYRQVPFYREGSLNCKGTEPYLQMLRALALLFQKMGYQGWVLLFDEGEAICQMSLLQRSQSYSTLYQLFKNTSSNAGLFPIFAFTEDFFQKLKNEDYEKARIRNEVEIPYFKQNYGDAFKDLNLFRLQDLSQKEWSDLVSKLILLYTKAYHWDFPMAQLRPNLSKRLDGTKGQETRFRIKALIDELDLKHQEPLLT